MEGEPYPLLEVVEVSFLLVELEVSYLLEVVEEFYQLALKELEVGPYLWKVLQVKQLFFLQQEGQFFQLVLFLMIFQQV